MIALIVSIRRDKTQQRALYIHIIPKIECSLEEAKPEGQGSHLFTLTNVSPIKIVSLSIKHYTLLYSKKEERFTGVGFVKPSEYLRWNKWIFQDELNPEDFISKEVGSANLRLPDTILVYMFDINYCRGTDMQNFNKRVFFFVDDNHIYDLKESWANSSYRKVVRDIEKILYEVHTEFGIPIDQNKLD